MIVMIKSFELFNKGRRDAARLIKRDGLCNARLFYDEYPYWDAYSKGFKSILDVHEAKYLVEGANYDYL